MLITGNCQTQLHFKILTITNCIYCVFVEYQLPKTLNKKTITSLITKESTQQQM